MQKIQKHIEIVRTTSPGLNSLSLTSAQAIQKTLRQSYASVGLSVANNLADLKQLAALQPDLVFAGFKYVPLTAGSNIKVWLADFLDEQGIAYTGSEQRAHELEHDKSLAKKRASEAGINTSPFLIAEQGKSLQPADIFFSYPVFIKPLNKGGGAGIDADSVAHTFTQLAAKVGSITRHHEADSLIEEYLPGREFSVAILKDEFNHEFSVMPLELIAPLNTRGQRFLSSAIKKADAESFVAVADGTLRTKISALAIDVFHALGARDYGRIDIRLDRRGIPQFLETNLIPSLIEGYGNFPKACLLNVGMDYKTMLSRIVRLGLARTEDTFGNVKDVISTPLLTPLPI